ncbi:unnamed protein product, partial [Laminaria digitata]
GAGLSGGVPSVDERAGVRRTPPGGNHHGYGGDTLVGRTLGVEAAGAEEDGVSVEGLWATWSPALFFLAGKSGAMIISCLKDAGLLGPHISRSGLGYDPLNYWSPLAPTPTPPSSCPPPVETPAGSSARAGAGGPARGFPAEVLGLPPVGERSRVAACLANRVFDDRSEAVSLLW